MDTTVQYGGMLGRALQSRPDCGAGCALVKVAGGSFVIRLVQVHVGGLYHWQTGLGFPVPDRVGWYRTSPCLDGAVLLVGPNWHQFTRCLETKRRTPTNRRSGVVLGPHQYAV